MWVSDWQDVSLSYMVGPQQTLPSPHRMQHTALSCLGGLCTTLYFHRCLNTC